MYRYKADECVLGILPLGQSVVLTLPASTPSPRPPGGLPALPGSRDQRGGCLLGLQEGPEKQLT